MDNFQSGMQAYQEGRWETAAKDLLKAWSAGVEPLQSLLGAGVSLVRAGDFERARKVYEQGIAEFPGNPSVIERVIG